VLTAYLDTLKKANRFYTHWPPQVPGSGLIGMGDVTSIGPEAHHDTVLHVYLKKVPVAASVLLPYI